MMPENLRVNAPVDCSLVSGDVAHARTISRLALTPTWLYQCETCGRHILRHGGNGGTKKL